MKIESCAAGTPVNALEAEVLKKGDD